MMTKTTLRMATKHLKACAAKGHEGCGMIVRTGKLGKGQKYIPADNLIESEKGHELIAGTHLPSQGFLIDPKLYLKHSRQIIAFVHSHLYTGDEPGEDNPSPTDIQRQKATAVPWVIFVMHDGKYFSHYEFGEDPSASA